jgi:hypothetical protein
VGVDVVGNLVLGLADGVGVDVGLEEGGEVEKVVGA